MCKHEESAPRCHPLPHRLPLGILTLCHSPTHPIPSASSSNGFGPCFVRPDSSKVDLFRIDIADPDLVLVFNLNTPTLPELALSPYSPSRSQSADRSQVPFVDTEDFGSLLFSLLCHTFSLCDHSVLDHPGETGSATASWRKSLNFNRAYGNLSPSRSKLKSFNG